MNINRGKALKKAHYAGFIARIAKNQAGNVMPLMAAAVFPMAAMVGGAVDLTNMRASQIALLVADNAGRVRTSIDETDINEVMIGARLADESMKLGAQGRIILSSLEPNSLPSPNTGQMIRWQRCFGNKNVQSSYGAQGDGSTNAILATGMGPAGRRIQAMNGAAIMFVELVYDYEPLMTDAFFEPRTVRYTAAYTVRERASNTLTNLQNLPTTQRRLCTNFSPT